MIPTAEILHRASEILKEIESLQAELAGLFGGGAAAGRTPRAESGAGPVRRRSMSAEGRARIARAAKARWARYRAGKGS